ncbi:hypothetical protein MSAN_01307800 [Mycena sanguinolenta]|uniref:Uncharacterized protein n=1 Tax=Mycena sanguinolenta TaxID=230812 RepID=A0A8H6YDS0_9AGAR|nr:hypothetical protein MSAN_01307800 [Mycena sanguinolenta]
MSKLSLDELVSMVSETKSGGILCPTTSKDTGRYERTGLAELVNMQITSGQFIGSRVSEPAYLPPHCPYAYYLVDHSTHAESWLENIDTDDLGLPPVVSISQLNILCEELYWNHVEFFPMHSSLSREILDSLICVFTHAICDQMTSRVSTFPYSKQDCEAFVSVLKNSRDHLSDGNIICTIASTSCPSLAIASASLFVASLLASTLLLNRYVPLQEVTAEQAMDYLEAIQSPTFKFQFIALVFALPHPLNLWGTLVLFANCIFMLALNFGTGFAAGISIVALLAFIAFQWITSDRFNLSLARTHEMFHAIVFRNPDASYTSEV